jgi:hypothetical protein
MSRHSKTQVPNLEEMDEQEAWQFLAGLLTNLDPEEEYAARHEDYVLEMPQSGERIRGRENMRAFQDAYPTEPSDSRMLRIRLRRVLVSEGLWVAEGVADYPDGRTLNVVIISELKDGRMWRDRWYFAEPFEAPEWRSRWVEQMDTGTPPRAGGDPG